MICIEPGLYVRVVEYLNGPHPRPLTSGFSEANAYRVMGLYNPAETSEGYFILSNDRDETWYISQRHFRTVAIMPRTLLLRMPLPVAICCSS
jgi:hypothetical protein